MHIQAAAAKIEKYATEESGDTLEMIERPHGGLSFVLVDGQRSGRSAKTISMLVAQRVISLLAEGVRDGAAARAANDTLYTQRAGKVSATLTILSVDMVTKSLVVSRNSHCPVIIQYGPGEQTMLARPVRPLGTNRYNKPEITEIPLEAGLAVVVFTDGILSAGTRKGMAIDLLPFVNRLYEDNIEKKSAARHIADGLLDEAIRLDDNRPADDTSVLALAVPGREAGAVRRMQIVLPIPPMLRP